MKKLLIITTNSSGNDKIPDTGVYLEEFAVPYLVFQKSDIEVTVASPEGGLSPVDENSMSCSNPEEWDKCIKILRETEKLSDIDLEEFDGVYFPGGHGPMFDLGVNERVGRCDLQIGKNVEKGVNEGGGKSELQASKEVASAVEYFFNSGKLVSAICHGPAAFVNTNIVAGKRVTSFTNEEEGIMKLKELVPFLLETKLRELGAEFIAEKPWAEHVEVDGNLITGQNQNSALLIAEKIVEYLNP